MPLLIVKEFRLCWSDFFPSFGFLLAKLANCRINLLAPCDDDDDDNQSPAACSSCNCASDFDLAYLQVGFDDGPWSSESN